MQIGGGSNYGMQVGSSMGNIAVKPKTGDSPKVDKTSSVPTGDSSKTKAPKGGDTVVDTSSDTQGLTETGGEIDSSPDLNEDGMGEIGDGIEGEDTGLDGMDGSDLEVEMEDEGLDVEVDEMDEPDVEDPSVDEPDGPDDPEVDDPSVDELDDPDSPDDPNNDENPPIEQPTTQGQNQVENLKTTVDDTKKGVTALDKGLEKKQKIDVNKGRNLTVSSDITKKTTSRTAASASTLSGVIDTTNKVMEGDFLGAADSLSDTVKDGVKTLGGDLGKTKYAQALQLKGAAKNVEKVFDSVVALVEDPSSDNLDKFTSELQGLISSVDGAKDVGKALVDFAKAKGPEFAKKMGSALAKAEAKLFGAVVKAGSKTAAKTALRAMGGPAAAAVAALDLGRAMIAGVEAMGDPTNPEKVGQAIKRGAVGVFSTMSVLPGAGWGATIAATGAELVPDWIYTEIGEEVIELFGGTPQTVNN